ncbi:MAG: hypothetical protein ACTSUC_15370, partial [Promethearchaeota archaeon]
IQQIFPAFFVLFTSLILKVNMGLSKKAIKEFKEIYFKEYGEKISDEVAREKGQRLLSLFKIIYRPIPEDYDEHDEN